MNLANALMFLGLAALPIPARALDGAPEGQAKVSAARSDAAALVKQLGDKDYKTRKEAYRLDRLEGDPDLATKDRLGDASRGTRTDDPLHDAIEEMHDSIRRMFGAKSFDDSLPGFGLHHGPGGWGGFGGQGGQIELGPGSEFSRSFDNNGQHESTSIRVDHDGRVTVEQEKNGEKTTLEAESLEALRKEHPELLQGLGGFGGMSFRIGPLGAQRSTVAPLAPRAPQVAPKLRAPCLRSGLEKPQEPAQGSQDDAAPRAELAPSNRPRLGVQVAPVKADVAEYLELDPGVGLEVVRVVEGSAAEKIGIQARDIITEVNGRTIKSVDDVAKALGGKDPAVAEVTVIRRGAEKTLDPRRK